MKLINPTIIALTTKNSAVYYFNFRRNGGRGCQPLNLRLCHRSDICCNLTMAALIASKNKVNHFNSRRRGGILASAAKLYLVAMPLSTRLVSETIWFVIGSDQRRPRSTPSSPEQSQAQFCFSTITVF